jgi:hypothetical protein
MRVSSLLYFVLAIILAIANTALGGTVSSNKLLSVALLALFQHLRVAVHPLLPASGTSLGAHISNFPKITLGTFIIAFFIKNAGFPIGYPALGTVHEAFLVPYTVCLGYLLLFTTLISRGASRQWANLALLVVLLTINTGPFSLNPIISLVSFVFRENSVIYAIHVAAITAAVFTVPMIERLETAVRKAQ